MLGNKIIEAGPFRAGDPSPLHRLVTADQFNELRNELIRLRKFEHDESCVHGVSCTEHSKIQRGAIL